VIAGQVDQAEGLEQLALVWIGPGDGVVAQGAELDAVEPARREGFESGGGTDACAAEFGLPRSSLSDDKILSGLEHQRVSQLSMGERRYLELLCVLALKRDYVILDEPFSRLAPLIGQEMLRRIREAAEAGTGVLVTDHYYRLLMESADRAYFLRGTRCREVDCSDLETRLEELGYLPAISVDRSR
jgi:hypothetical protein